MAFLRNIGSIAFSLSMLLVSMPAHALVVDGVYEKARQLRNCNPEKNDCLQATQKLFRKYLEFRPRAYTMIQPENRKTRHVALLIHSYTMGPDEMARIGENYFRHGFNVVAIQLTAHGGVDDIPMQEVSEDYWKADVEFGLDIASQLGEKTVITGYSLGGLLSVHAALTHPEKIEGIALYAPAVWLGIPLSRLACTGKLLINTDFVSHQVAQEVIGRPASRYEKAFVSGGCQIRALISEIEQLSPYERDPMTESNEDWYKHMSRIYGRIQVPAMVVNTESDEIIDPDMVKHLAKSMPRASWTHVFVQDEQISHLSVHYHPESTRLLTRFIEQNFGK